MGALWQQRNPTSGFLSFHEEGLSRVVQDAQIGRFMGFDPDVALVHGSKSFRDFVLVLELMSISWKSTPV